MMVNENKTYRNYYKDFEFTKRYNATFNEKPPIVKITPGVSKSKNLKRFFEKKSFFEELNIDLRALKVLLYKNKKKLNKKIVKIILYLVFSFKNFKKLSRFSKINKKIINCTLEERKYLRKNVFFSIFIQEDFSLEKKIREVLNKNKKLLLSKKINKEKKKREKIKTYLKKKNILKKQN